jgi:periplasmic copper chaperone A
MRALLFALALAASPALAQVSIDQPWMRATAPGAKVAGGFMIVRNKGEAPDRLVAAASPLAERVELHVHIDDGGVMKMRQVKGFDVPANGRFELKPGAAHLMFMNIKRQIKEGEKIPVTLTFEKAGEVKAEYHVGGLGDMGPAGAAQGGGMKH